MPDAASVPKVLLLRGGLTGRVYAVTKWRDLGEGRIEALVKHDVTDQYEALQSAPRSTDVAVPVAAAEQAVMFLRSISRTRTNLDAEAAADAIQAALDATPRNTDA